ncbi:MAG: hypothetical protein AAF368_00100 [Planctomycetota bacterium]
MQHEEEFDESPRNFGHFLGTLAEGVAHIELSDELQALVASLHKEATTQNRKVKGKLTLQLSFVCDPTGVVGIAYGVKSVKPERQRPGSVRWATQGGALELQNPRQLQLGQLKEVINPQSAHKVRAAPRADEGAKEA